MLKQTLLAFLLYTFTLDSASGKPDGSPDACADHPDHGVNPQKSDNPYTMTKEKNEDSFNIDISSDKGATFKGIMIRAVGPSGMTVGGRWRIDKKKYKEIKSKDGKCVAVTHKSDNEKWKATFKFTPSDSKPEPKFKVIVVKDKETFWSGIEL